MEENARKNKRSIWNEIQKRVRDNPNNIDVMNGSALTRAMTDLIESRFDDTTFGYAKVPLSVDVIRRIPFRINDQGAELSMRRLSLRGKDKWPPGLQDAGLDRERKAVARAFENALDEQVDARIQKRTLDALNKSIDDLLAARSTGASRGRTRGSTSRRGSAWSS